MDREKEDRLIFIENILCPVSVVDIPIHNRDLSNPVFALKITSGNCDVVEQAKPHTSVLGRVMSRGTPHREAVFHCSRYDRICDT